MADRDPEDQLFSSCKVCKQTTTIKTILKHMSHKKPILGDGKLTCKEHNPEEYSFLERSIGEKRKEKKKKQRKNKRQTHVKIDACSTEKTVSDSINNNKEDDFSIEPTNEEREEVENEIKEWKNYRDSLQVRRQQLSQLEKQNANVNNNSKLPQTPNEITSHNNLRYENWEDWQDEFNRRWDKAFQTLQNTPSTPTSSKK